MNRSQFKRLGVFACLAIAAVSSGCGGSNSNQGIATGKVTIDGQPITRGSILFTPIDGAMGSVVGGPISNGCYELKGKAGPAVGWNRVEIHAMRKTGKMVQKPYSPQGVMVEDEEEAVPASYNTESTLKTEIKPGPNTANFEIVSK